MIAITILATLSMIIGMMYRWYMNPLDIAVVIISIWLQNTYCGIISLIILVLIYFLKPDKGG